MTHALRTGFVITCESCHSPAGIAFTTTGQGEARLILACTGCQNNYQTGPVGQIDSLPLRNPWLEQLRDATRSRGLTQLLEGLPLLGRLDPQAFVLTPQIVSPDLDHDESQGASDIQGMTLEEITNWLAKEEQWHRQKEESDE